MKKLSAMVVIAVVLCSGMAFSAQWDWDVTARVSTNADFAGIPDGYWLYEYAWEVIANDRGDGKPSTPQIAHVWVGSAPGILFNAFGFDSEAPDENDWPPPVPALSSLGAYSETWLNGLGYTAYTGGYWLNTPGTVFESSIYGRVAMWSNFTMVGSLAQNQGLAFYTSYVAPRPPRDVPWSIDNGSIDGGTTLGPTPEPASALLLLLGLPIAARLRRRGAD